MRNHIVVLWVYQNRIELKSKLLSYYFKLENTLRELLYITIKKKTTPL